MNPNETEPNFVKTVRKQLGLTLDQFAVALGRDRSHISLVENGRRPITKKMRKEVAALLSHSSQTISNSVVNNGSGFVINRPDPSEPSAPHPEPLTAIEVLKAP